MQIPVTLSDPLPTTTSVRYSLAAGTATAGSDFTLVTNKTLSFAANVVRAIINVRVLSDSIDEGDETLSVTLFSPSGGPGLGRSLGTATIIDDDPGAGVVVGVGDVSVVEGDTGPASGAHQAMPTIAQLAVTLNAIVVDGFRAISNGRRNRLRSRGLHGDLDEDAHILARPVQEVGDRGGQA